jgi:predicted heme/steroid binding protein
MGKLPWLAGISAGICALLGLLPWQTGAHQASAQAQKIPASLMDVGEFAENIYDLAKAKDWPKAVDKHKALEEAAKQLASDLKSAADTKKRLVAALTTLGKAVAAKDQPATMHAANQVTVIAADLIEPFNPQVPAAVMRLDYFGRELELGVMAKETDKLKTTAEAIRKTWEKLRPAVKSKGGDAEAKRFDGLVAQVTAAKSVEDYGKLVTPILDEVDNLERVFKK